ncbi:FkbM family methyltransferase [Algoriphagus yeomjeoni]|uniref:Methyltransferase FkbM-like protein n=1 Tax=Algoriphagus yeomjeoni TaxID=291403 RepID=A0A327P1W5_9BACT|nr:FkbM family methyltransferase [Algoriphagus yeomjeoni]RAI85561.1 methyltransferase FkbM-like protein [Algoriphagus yeomjeoni]
MRNLIYHAVKPLLDHFHVSLEPRVFASQVKDFIKKLHPKESIKPLIRLGPDGDGGYLLPDDMEGIVACFSPGVDVESRFELQLAERGMPVFLADYSVTQPKHSHPLFHFSKKYLGAIDHGIYMSMDRWLTESLPEDNSSDLLLQMDIEGFEYETIFSMSQQLLNRFRIIVIEFHSFDRMFEKQFFRNLNRAFEKLLINHSIVHIHPNNLEKPVVIKGIDIPPYIEFTLVRNDRVKTDVFAKPGKHKLDQDNVPSRTVVLSDVWYHS